MHPLDLRDSSATRTKIACSAAPAAAIASGLLSPAAWGAPGDLDPSFGDVGRAYPFPDLTGQAWSVLAQEGDESIFAGGDHYDGFYYGPSASGFTQRLAGNGSIDQTFAALSLADTEVLDVAIQSDGKVIGVGRTPQNNIGRFSLTVFRLDADGVLDPAFGDGGIARFGAASETWSATSVALDPDGSIVVAGLQGTWAGVLAVLRFLPDGTLDTGFGVNGVFQGPIVQAYVARPQILRTSDGRYRVTATTEQTSDSDVPVRLCRVLGLTSNGALDTTFGTGGVAGVEEGTASPVTCSALAAQPGDGLLVAGSSAGGGMLVRLVASGVHDDTFSAPDVTAGMAEVTALGVDGDGQIMVAGRGLAGVSGALVVRLQADGQLDALFGNAGSTWLDLPLSSDSEPRVHDIAMLPDGGALLAGGTLDVGVRRPFVARLLGTEGGDGPGVLGIERRSVTTTEQEQDAIVTVRRMGGRSGAVSIAYETRAASSGVPQATPGVDYTTLAGRLTWADGDGSDQQIIVPIASDSPYEGPEALAVALHDVQGGAALGTGTAEILIPADPDYKGVLSFGGNGEFSVTEGMPYANLLVQRESYDQGAVSVTVALASDDATPGSDYTPDPVTVSWADGETGPKLVGIPILNDKRREPEESITATLTNATPGAILGTSSTATIRISDNDHRSGGGRFGFTSWLLLAVASILRRLRGRRLRSDTA